MNRKSAVQRELTARLKNFRRALPDYNVQVERRGDGLAITATSVGDLPEGAARLAEVILPQIDRFNSEVAEKYTRIAVEMAALRDEIDRFQRANPGARTALSVDQLAAEFLRAYNARESLKRHDDYRSALLTPGLSPAQRRLLFNRAQVEILRERLAATE